MLTPRRLLSMQTQNICPLIRIADTPSIGVVVPPDRFFGTALGSSLYPTEGCCLIKSVFIIYLEYAKDIHLSFLYCAFFFLVKNRRKISYNRNPIKRHPSNQSGKK
jgi:hypothetical protein